MLSDDNNARIVVWTKLQTTPGLELGAEQWTEHLQPLFHE